MRTLRLAPLALAAVLSMGPALAAAQAPPAALPKTATAPRAMVSAANPLAAAAGLKVLQDGGSAVDAAVAIQAVLGLVEPQSSGLGGGAFLLHYDAQTKAVTAYNGRETAPKAAGPDLFLGEDGRPLPFPQAVTSGRATGVPGAVAMLAMAHKDQGKLGWATLFEAPTRLAAEGFVVTPRLARFINGTFGQARTPDSAALFTKPGGDARYQAGDLFRNPAYAHTLRRVAAEGPAALLQGDIARAIVAKTGQAPLPGAMTLADLAAYRPQKTQALCAPYKAYVLCAPPPPSGGIAVLELMGLLARTDIDARGPGDARAWLQFAEASRLAYADRDQYIADPDFVAQPIAGLLAPAYLDERARLIGERAAPTVSAGRPMGAQARAADNTLEPAGTSHFTVMDADGDVVTMTTTVESVFGTGRVVAGFFLNNQLTDFSFSPTTPTGAPVANAVAGGKRPRSSMSPTLVLDRDGGFVAALGSPGGTSIIAYVGKALVGTLAWELPIDRAIALPNLIARGDAVGVESTLDPAMAEALRTAGLNLTPGRGEESGLHGVQKVPGGVLGAADPRREGAALGF